MIETDKRKAVFLLHREGMSVREITRRLKLSRNTVRAIIAGKGVMPCSTRRDKQQIDPQLLRSLHEQCRGRIQRMHEKLVEEEDIRVSYSTLTAMLRKLGITKAQKTRCHRVPDEPGVEMQHDTTLYSIRLGDRKHKIIASLIYLRYSKRRYLKLYRSFDRFRMKCFIHEALTFWGYSAAQCIIDNTNLARLRGTGKSAVIVPEMENFSRQYGFKFLCHELKHPNRKAGGERSFWTVETNFLPGRTFENLEDLNRQALQWATERLEKRPQGKAGLIPAKAFEHERTYLTALTAHLPAPYRIHGRGIDEYGHVAFQSNFYWVAGTDRGEVTVLEYAHRLKIYRDRQLMAEYSLPPDGISNEKFSPKGLPKPPHQPSNRRRSAVEEEKRLRAIGPSVGVYLDWVLGIKGLGRNRFLRSLLALSRRMTSELFIKSVERAAQYRIEDIATIQRIAVLYLQQGSSTLPSAVVDEHFTQREAYLEGSLTDAPDLSIYQDPSQEDPPQEDPPQEDPPQEDPPQEDPNAS